MNDMTIAHDHIHPVSAYWSLYGSWTINHLFTVNVNVKGFIFTNIYLH